MSAASPVKIGSPQLISSTPMPGLSDEMQAKLTKFQSLVNCLESNRITPVECTGALVAMRDEAERTKDTDQEARIIFDLTSDKIAKIHYRTEIYKINTLTARFANGVIIKEECREGLVAIRNAAVMNTDETSPDIYEITRQTIYKIDFPSIKRTKKSKKSKESEEAVITKRIERVLAAPPQISRSVALQSPRVELVSEPSTPEKEPASRVVTLDELIELGELVVETHPETQGTLDQFRKEKEELTPKPSPQVTPASSRTPTPVLFDSSSSPRSISPESEGNSSRSPSPLSDDDVAARQPYRQLAKFTAKAAVGAFQFVKGKVKERLES